MILEEMIVHGENPAYVEDLKVIIELLRLSKDPEVEEKVMALINSADTPRESKEYLQDFISNFHPSPQPKDNPWSRAARLDALNKRYVAATKLLDSGKSTETLRSLDAILSDEPGYPFAVALKDVIVSQR
jgi:hypothetical protein